MPCAPRRFKCDHGRVVACGMDIDHYVIRPHMNATGDIGHNCYSVTKSFLLALRRFVVCLTTVDGIDTARLA